MDRQIQPTLTPELEKKLGDIIKDLEASNELGAFWGEVLKRACQTLSAEAGTFFELSTDHSSLTVVASYGILPRRLSQASFPLDKGICGWIARHRQAVCVNEVASDSRFNGEVDLLTQFKTLAVLGAPVAIPDRLYGIVEILNPRERPFTLTDTQFLEALGGSAASLYHLRKR